MPLPAQQKLEMYGVRHCYIEFNNTGTLGFHRVWFTKKCDLKVVTTKLEFSGDGRKFHKNYGYELEGSIEAEIDDTTLDSLIWSTPATANNGTTDDFSVRYVKGTTTEFQSNFVGIRLSIDAEDADTGALVVVRFRVLKAQFDPDQPQAMQTAAVVGRMLTFSARPSTTDIIGASLTGMPSGGGFMVKDIITDSTKFDPVPGDIL